jgi:hypothetical protein
VKLEREVKQASEMANRREKEAKSGQMKGDGSGIERASGPSEVHFQKILPVERVHANLPFSEVP